MSEQTIWQEMQSLMSDARDKHEHGESTNAEFERWRELLIKLCKDQTNDH